MDDGQYLEFTTLRMKSGEFQPKIVQQLYDFVPNLE